MPTYVRIVGLESAGRSLATAGSSPRDASGWRLPRYGSTLTSALPRPRGLADFGVYDRVGFLGYIVAWIVMPEEPYMLAAPAPSGQQVTNQ